MKKTVFLIALVFITVISGLPEKALADSPADFLFQDSEQFYEPDISNGPWIYHSDSLSVSIIRTYESKVLCYIADIYIRNNETAFTGWAKMKPYPNTTQLPHIIAREYKAVFGLTGDFVTHRQNKKGVMIRDGVVYFDKKDADNMAVLPSGELEVFKKGAVTAKELSSMGVKDSLAFGPIIVQDGKMTEEINKHHLKPPNVRTGIGKVEDGHYIAIVTRGKINFEQYAKVFIKYGCIWAYNLDGGHSASMIIMGEQVNGHSNQAIFGTYFVRQRPLADMLLFGKSELVPDKNKKAVYEGSR